MDHQNQRYPDGEGFGGGRQQQQFWGSNSSLQVHHPLGPRTPPQPQSQPQPRQQLDLNFFPVDGRFSSGATGSSSFGSGREWDRALATQLAATAQPSRSTAFLARSPSPPQFRRGHDLAWPTSSVMVGNAQQFPSQMTMDNRPQYGERFPSAVDGLESSGRGFGVPDRSRSRSPMGGGGRQGEMLFNREKAPSPTMRRPISPFFPASSSSERTFSEALSMSSWLRSTPQYADNNVGGPAVRGDPHFDDRRMLPSTMGPSTLGGSSSSIGSSTAGVETIEVIVKEYLDDEAGVCQIMKSSATGFFHRDSVWLVDDLGNPYGPPVRFTSRSSRTQTWLRDEIPVGTEMKARVVLSKEKSFSDGNVYFQVLVLDLWPRTTDAPPQGTDSRMSQLLFQLRSYQDRLHVDDLVEATVHWPLISLVECRICAIKGDNFGVIEVRISDKNINFYALFHKDSVWLKDGKRCIDVAFFRDKPLSALVTEGQQVNMSARSICVSRGRELFPSVLELQAVSVSLDPESASSNAPGATRCDFGPGTYEPMSMLSAFYFDPSLRQKLNRQLAQYLESAELLHPYLNKRCVEVIGGGGDVVSKTTQGDFQQPQTQQQPREPPDSLMGCKGILKMVLDRAHGVIEELEGRFSCLLMLRDGAAVDSLTDRFPLGSEVVFNAKLVNARLPISYATDTAWRRRAVVSEEQAMTIPVLDDQLLKSSVIFNSQLYSGETKNVMDSDREATVRQLKEEGAAKKAPGPEVEGAGETLHRSLEKIEGVVCKIIDPNFGLIRPDPLAKVPDKLVLFDTCELWLDSGDCTAHQQGKGLQDILQVGDRVLLNAVMVDQAEQRVPYLATMVCNLNPTAVRPKTLSRVVRLEEILKEKIDIHRMVVKSVTEELVRDGDLMAEPPAAASRPIVSRTLADVVPSVAGTIKSVFIDSYIREVKGDPGVVGGLIQFDGNRSAFFRIDAVEVPQRVIVGLRVRFNYVNLHPRELPPDWPSSASPAAAVADNVYSVALSVFEGQSKAEDVSQIAEKVSSSISVMEVVVNEDPSAILSEGTRGVFFIGGPKMRGPGAAAGSSADPAIGSRSLPLVMDCEAAKLKCMINEKAGLLSSLNHPDVLCYFEIDDVNVIQPVNLVDLVMALRMANIQFQARLMENHRLPPPPTSSSGSEGGLVQYVANEQGVQVVGGLPQFLLGYVHLGPRTKSRSVVTIGSEKIKRYQRAKNMFRKGEVRSLADFVQKAEKLGGGGGVGDPAAANVAATTTTTTSTKVVGSTPDVVGQVRLVHANESGTVRYILNENFGLVQGKDDQLALFDTCDFYLPNGSSAADVGKSLHQLLTVQDLVHYNACMVDPASAVPYLCTGVWVRSAENDRMTANPPPPLQLESVQPEKLKIYKQVAETSTPLAKAILKDIRAKQPPPAVVPQQQKPNSSLEVRQEAIEEVYRSPLYCTYVKEVPKKSRHCLHPATPDVFRNVSDQEWSASVSEWKRDLEEWDYRLRQGSKKDILKSDKITGMFVKEGKGDPNYAILSLSNGCRALLHKRRIWYRHGCPAPFLNVEGCSYLASQRYRNMHVVARSLHVGREYGFEYQVICCFDLPEFNADLDSKIPPGKKNWLENRHRHDHLNTELKQYFASIGGLNKNEARPGGNDSSRNDR